MCIYQTKGVNKKYTKTKKNGGIIPPVYDERTRTVYYDCGRCYECRNKVARDWQLRMKEEIKESKNGKFITLTFSNESIKALERRVLVEEKLKWRKAVKEGKSEKDLLRIERKLEGYGLDNQIATRAVRLFMERWRKKYEEVPRHWLITELGHEGTENIHLHGILFTDKKLEEVAERWGYGFIWPRNEKQWRAGYVSNKTVNYIIKYVKKVDEDHVWYKAKVLNSPGIGRNFKNSFDAKRMAYKGVETIRTYKTETGHKTGIPTYWRNKIYNEEEREKMWIESMDSGKKYVGGIEVDISNGDEEYWKLIQVMREKNARLGYGTDKINWDEVRQENEKRDELRKRRTGKI